MLRFSAQKWSKMNHSRILPFYMTYPLPMYYQQEDTVTRDLEYLQQMYPAEAKRYQKIIAEMLDRMDYEGSMIYDEYPDKWQIYRLTQLITDKIRKEDAEQRAADSAEKVGEGQESDKETAKIMAAGENEERLNDFVQILLSYEIYRRRHTNRNGILKF